MIAMPLSFSGIPQPHGRGLAIFQPLDPNILNASIPTFFIGRDRDGFWLARDARGEVGGIFLFRSSALAFARRASRPLGCATIFLSERFELDIQNQGNPFIASLKLLLQFAISTSRRIAGR